MWPLRLNHGEPHCGQASLGVIRFSHASPLLAFCHGPEYHKLSKSITRIALPAISFSMMRNTRIAHRREPPTPVNPPHPKSPNAQFVGHRGSCSFTSLEAPIASSPTFVIPATLQVLA